MRGLEIPLSYQDFFDLKMLSAHYVSCINLNELQNTFTMEANAMNPDQTAPKEPSDLALLYLQ